jgi:uncharacterized protein (TIGR02217 family)
MTSSIYPSLPGLDFGSVRTPRFNTSTQASISGYESRIARMAYPIYTFKLKYEFLRSGAATLEMQTLAGFFLSMQGSFNSFLYTDPDDYSVTNQSIGTGDGATTTFQLVRSYGAGGFTLTEPVHNTNSTPVIKVDGVTKTVTTDYTISATGLVTFVTAPASTKSITWSGTFYYKCRFKDDSSDFDKFMQDLWSNSSVTFYGSTMNKL